MRLPNYKIFLKIKYLTIAIYSNNIYYSCDEPQFANRISENDAPMARGCMRTDGCRAKEEPFPMQRCEMIRIDSDNLAREMRARDITSHDLAFLLGRNDATVMSRLSGATDWIYEEAVMIRDCLFPELKLEYLFRYISREEERPSVQKGEQMTVS